MLKIAKIQKKCDKKLNLVSVCMYHIRQFEEYDQVRIFVCCTQNEKKNQMNSEK